MKIFSSCLARRILPYFLEGLRAERANKSKPTMEAQAAEGSETMVVRHTLHPDLLLGVDRGLNFDLGNLAAFSYQPIDPSVAK